MRLSFEVARTGDEVVVSGDVDGLKLLIDAVQRLVLNTREGEFEHTHFHTPEWAGNELTAVPWIGGEFVLAHHVKLYCIKGDRPAA